MKLHNKKDFGNSGEIIAENYLIDNNYQIVEKKFLCRQGEIDIIAKKDEYIVFIEVKTRSGMQYGLENEFVRFDVVEVLLYGGKFWVNHIEQIM